MRCAEAGVGGTGSSNGGSGSAATTFPLSVQTENRSRSFVFPRRIRCRRRGLEQCRVLPNALLPWLAPVIAGFLGTDPHCRSACRGIAMPFREFVAKILGLRPCQREPRLEFPNVIVAGCLPLAHFVKLPAGIRDRGAIARTRHGRGTRGDTTEN